MIDVSKWCEINGFDEDCKYCPKRDNCIDYDDEDDDDE